MLKTEEADATVVGVGGIEDRHVDDCSQTVHRAYPALPFARQLESGAKLVGRQEGSGLKDG